MNGSISVSMHTVENNGERRGKCWERNFSEEFPICYVNSRGNEATIIVGAPHSDYKITTHLKNKRMDGESRLFSEKNVLVAKLTFVDGIANGPCTLYDENGALFFEGSFVNGYRQGKGKEYENDIVVYEGLFEKGKKLVKMTEMDGYWKEYDNSKNLHSVCKKDEEGRNDGVCFFYENGEISRLSEWHEGKETPFNGHFRLYDETNRKWIEGEYKDGVRNGESREYDENGIKVFEGYYENGKKSNMARLDEMPGYWKEYDENNYYKSICKKDKYGRYEGVCYFYENGTVNKISEWRDGREYPFHGYFKFYDAYHSNWLDGFYYEGRILNFSPMTEMEGFWKEYDTNGNLIHICEIDDKGNYNGVCYNFENGLLRGICRWERGREVPFNGYYKVYNVIENREIEGYYISGKLLNMVRSDRMPDYWKEYDENDHLKSICKKDIYGRYEGVCYFYENETMTKISEWMEGRENPFHGYFKLFDEPNSRWLDGFYYEGRILNFSPMKEMEGFWKEYDTNGNLIHICEIDDKGNYNGVCYNFENGLLRGICRWERGREVPFNGYYKVYNVIENREIEGYYISGKLLNMVRSDRMPDYWKEYDENDHLKSICKKDIYGRYEGVCYFYENETMTKISEWQEGTEISLSGTFNLFDDSHNVWCKGRFNNGLREGKCIECDTSGNILFEGYYKNGNKLIPCKNMKDYLEELDNEGKIVRICQIDAEGRYKGLSYQYRENQIIRVSRWEKDKEIEPLKSFHNGIMTEYKDGKKCYSGGYIPSLKLNYPRQGEGEEFDIDGETLLYKGHITNGIRDGYGKLFEHNQVVYDGKWKKGIKMTRYVLYLVLTLAFMLLTSAASFIFLNAYVGAYVSGLCLILICFHFNKNAGYLATGLLSVMFCFFVSLYAGIIASIALVIITTLYLNVLAGLVPIGLLIAAACLYNNTFAGIFAIGLYLIYLLFLVVHCCGWKKSIIWSSAVYILSLCTIVTLLLIFKNADLMKYVIIFAVGGFLILMLSWIAGCKKETINTLLSSAIIILISCTIISLFLHSVQPFYTKYVVISLVGFLLIFIVNLIVSESGGSTTIVLKCAAAIVVCCIIVCTAVGSDSVPILRYVSVFAGGLLLIIIISYFTGFNKENIHILLSSSGLIIWSCVMINILLSSINLSSIKNYLVFLIGIILFFFIYFIVSLCRGNMGIVVALFFIYLIVCGVIILIMTSVEMYAMRYVVVAVTGVLLIIIISCITGCNSENMHILMSSSGLIVCCCIIISFFLSSMSIESMKYYLVFLIGVTLFFLIYFLVSLCRGDLDIMPATLGIILVLCVIGDLIMGSFEFYLMRFITVIVIAFFIFIILLVCTECGTQNTHILISGIGLLLCACYFICWWLGAYGILYSLYIAILVGGSLVVFIVYFLVSLNSDDLDAVGATAGIMCSLCFLGEIILLCIDFEVVRFFLIYLIGLILVILIIANCECLREIWPLSVILVCIAFFGCTLLCMMVGGDDNEIILSIFEISKTLIAVIVFCICAACCCHD